MPELVTLEQSSEFMSRPLDELIRAFGDLSRPGLRWCALYQ